MVPTQIKSMDAQPKKTYIEIARIYAFRSAFATPSLIIGQLHVKKILPKFNTVTIAYLTCNLNTNISLLMAFRK